MVKSSYVKKERQKLLKREVARNPFLTDEDLSEMYKVSVPTIRLDRLELKIPEYRERIRDVAKKLHGKVKSIKSSEFVGELLDITLGKNAMSVLETDESMAFENTQIVQGKYIYSLAESLAISVIDSSVALVGVANIKYKTPVYSGSKLFAKAEVKRNKGNSFIIWVHILRNKEEVFRGKFILVSLEIKNEIKNKE